MPRVSVYRVPDDQHMEVAVDADWSCTHYGTEERNFSLQSIQVRFFSVVCSHSGKDEMGSI